MVRHRVGTYRANTLTKGSRECVKDVHGWCKPFGKSFIAALRLIQLVGFPLKHGENGIRRATAFDLLRERVGSEFFSGLPLVLF